MADLSKELIIRIVTILKKEGIEAAQRELQSTLKSLESVEQGGKAAGEKSERSFGSFNKEISSAKRTMQAFNQVLNGVASTASGNLMVGLRGAAGAARGLTGVAAAVGPWVAAAAALAALGVVAYNLHQKFSPAKKAMEEAQKAAADAAEAVKREKDALESLDQISQQNAIRQADELRKKLQEASTAASQLRDRMASIEDATLARDLANIDLRVARGEMTREEGDLLKADQTTKSQARKRSIDRMNLDLEEEQLRAEQARAEADAQAKRQAADDARRAEHRARTQAHGQTPQQAQSLLRTNEAVLGSMVEGITDPDIMRRQQERVAELRRREFAARVLQDRRRAALASDRAAQEAEAVAAAARDEAARKTPAIEARRTVLSLEEETAGIKYSGSRVAYSTEAQKRRAEAREEQAKRDAAAAEARGPGEVARDFARRSMGGATATDAAGRTYTDPGIVEATRRQDMQEISDGIRQGLSAEEIATAVRASGTVIRVAFQDLVKEIRAIQSAADREAKNMKSRQNLNRD